MARSYVKRAAAQARAYSQAAITEGGGGRTIWLAGQVAGDDDAGRCRRIKSPSGKSSV
jgi:hypothetical protein